MPCGWMPFVLAWVSMATPTFCQSGDWGSGFDIYSSIIATNDTSQAAGDEPVRIGHDRDRAASAALPPSLTPTPQYDPRPDECSVHFSTSAASPRRLKAQEEELAYLQVIQRGNKAVLENLEAFVGAELGDQSYEDVIKENIVGIADDHGSLHGEVEKAEEDMKKQLEGEAPMQKIREESSSFEEMMRAAADIANRLEISSKALHASFTRQPKGLAKMHR
ncbi:uncharacterized protein si:ch211-142k18.1 [Pseudoliparis swirei]|uniref:uncharacterized protein si:ch211-142k18.1 n=1 Tax=Pseudoliparis swirei TaxID=2059687 RepID=UPI0024BE8CE9|nr:uncharacterized protein si:ch211-142k18.1 [Pseudoliparis swirei]